MSAELLTAETLLERIRRDGVRRTAIALRKPPVPSRLLTELAARTDVPEARQFVAAYSLSPSHLLETLATTAPDPAVLSLLATNPRTPPHLLVEFAAHPEAVVRAHAAAHPQLPPRELLALAGDTSTAVRRSLAANPSLRLPHQALLTADREAGVRVLLAGQSSLPAPVALVLGADASAVVRVHTVSTVQAEDELLLGWAASDEADVQLALSQREDLPAAANRVLLHAPHAAVRRAVRESSRPDEVDLLHLATRGEADERLWVAGRVPLARPLQRLLAQDEAQSVRAELAANPSLHSDIAHYFVGQADEAACIALAGNPGVSAELIQELVALRQPAVLAALAYRDTLDEELARFLIAHSAEFRRHWAIQQRPISGLDAATAQTLFADPLPLVRALAVAGHAWRRVDLYDLARDPVALVRIAAIRHPHAPDGLLTDWQNDPDPDVAAAAREAHAIRLRQPPAPTLPAAPTRAVPLPSAASAAATASDPAFSARAATAPSRDSEPRLFNKLKRLFWQ